MNPRLPPCGRKIILRIAAEIERMVKLTEARAKLAAVLLSP
jgi:hypothetical protein